jgi:hypothetical protein
MSKLELIKQLEYLSAFQAECLRNKDWDSFDKAERKIDELETLLLRE